jgi:large subunit ribosomal protein L15e
MAQSAYSYMKKAWMNLDKETLKSRMIQWRASESVTELEHPTRLDRAHILGYKAKKGFVIVRVRVIRGGRQRKRHDHGRKSRKQHVRKILKMSYQWVAELRASKKYPNLEVLNSYPLGKDGKHYFYEVILMDPNATEIKNNPKYNWISRGSHKGRAERGLTSAARKSRGLSTRSPDMKVRPSLRSWNRKGK